VRPTRTPCSITAPSSADKPLTARDRQPGAVGWTWSSPSSPSLGEEQEEEPALRGIRRQIVGVSREIMSAAVTGRHAAPLARSQWKATCCLRSSSRRRASGVMGRARW
jgi:hypothetical protein